MVDFEKHPDWSVIFDRNLDPERIVAELEIQLNAKINRGEDQHGDHVPKNFYEFLLATGSDKLSEIILKEPEKLPRSVHGSLLEQLRNYMYIGGMPECVKSWAQTKSMADVFDIQSDLINTFKQDFGKYAPRADKRGLHQALCAVAKYIGHPVKYSRLSDDFSGPTNKKAIDLLTTARLIHKVYSTSPASLPFTAAASERKFKAILADTGLMRALSSLPPQSEFVKNDLLGMYHGALAEQFTGQKLRFLPLYYAGWLSGFIE